MQVGEITKINVAFSNRGKNEQVSLKDKKDETQKTTNFYAGGIFADDKDMQLSDKKAQAQKSSLKVLLDQQKKDLELDKKEEGLVDHQKEMFSDVKDYSDKIADIDNQKGDLKKNYGITDNDKSDLNLVDKQQRILDGSGEMLTDQESSRMNQLTEYTSESMNLDKASQYYDAMREKSKDAVTSDNMTMFAYKQANAKDQGMIKAQEQAKSIMNVTSQDVVDYLYKQLKENIDKTTDDEDKKSESKDKNQTSQTSDTSNTTTTNQTGDTNASNQDNVAGETDTAQTKSIIKQDIKKDNFQAEVKNLIKKENIIEDDTKGVAVDQKV